jgi:predicted AAA+ superfamily ATPase
LKLLNFGGFPEPFLKQNTLFSNKWQALRNNQLFREELRDLTQIQELGQIEFLATLLQNQTGQLVNYTSLAKAIKISVPTVIRWINCLENFYFCFKIQPWFKNIKRSLIKEPKIYLWDWSLIKDPGAKAENFVASHLLKAIHFWQDLGLGDYQLTFIRNKEKQEVDFLIVKNNTPWILIEVKLSKKSSLNQALFLFKEETNVKYAFQLVFDLESTEENCFDTVNPIVVPVQNFLSQLV